MVVVVTIAGMHMSAFVKATSSNTLRRHCLDMQLDVIGLELTFAGIYAFKPPVINVFAATSSAVLKPSTARSAATDCA